MCKKIALIGYGKVGKALVELLSEVDPKGKDFVFSSIASRSLGLVELNKVPSALVNSQIEGKRQNIRLNSTRVMKVAQEITSWLKEGNYDILIEATIPNYDTGEPALSYIQTALEQGKDTITCNKAPIALAFDQLHTIAAQSDALLRYESTVMDGTPVISMFRKVMPEVQVESIRGVLNSTVSVILDSFYGGMNLEQGIARAQALDVAEEDPSLDLKGTDAAAKLVILANTLSEMKIKLADVETQSLTQETFEDTKSRGGQGHDTIIRQVSTADFHSETFRIALEPVQPDDILYSCRGTTNAAVFSLKLFGELIIAERNPTLESTAFGVYSDLVDICQQKQARI